MADELPEDVEVTNETPVIVGDVDTAPDEVTNEGDTVVIVDTAPTDDGADSDDASATDLDHERRITQLEMELGNVRSELALASFKAEEALDATDELAAADEAIVAATDEAIVETIEGAEIEDEDGDGDEEITTDEVAPVSTRKHILFRSFAELRNRD